VVIRRGTRWGLACAFWGFITLLYTLQIWAISTVEPLQLRRILIWQSAFYLGWIPFTVLVWQATDRWDLARLGARRWLARHAVTFAGVSVVHVLAVISAGMLLAPGPNERFVPAFTMQLRGRAYFEIIIYAGVAAVGYAMTLYRHRREREADAARLEAQLAAARLDALRGQLHPHFLFNSLHAISSLVRERRNDDAVRLISGMSDLLRSVLATEVHELPLRTEIDLVRRYVDIQQVRFSDRLTVDISTDPATLDLSVPPLLIQPLVENAIRHGMSPRTDRTTIRICTSLGPGHVLVTVADDGVGLPEGWSIDKSQGTGLRNLRDRLNAMYGTGADLSVTSTDGGGVHASVRVPVHA
jgi:two-component system LytT family sensor kinase